MRLHKIRGWGKKRLLILAAFMDGLKETKTESFHMQHWGTKELCEIEEQKPLDLTSCHGRVKVNQEFECHTTACLLGWAAQIPALNRAGLKMEWEGDGIAVDGNRFEAHISYKGDDFDINPIEAAIACFDLTEEQAVYLFGGEGPHKTPKQAAREIRRIVNEAKALAFLSE